MVNELPLISVVVIGINISEKVVNCLKSVKKSNYPNLEIIYVDGGSSDDSVKKVRKLGNIKIIELKQENPAPGRQRNEGWKNSKADLVQFLDGDTILDPDWLINAIYEIKDKKVAVCGYRRELYPNKNFYNFITDFDWGKSVGEIENIGGDILIKKSVLYECEGFDNNLIAGENSELSFKIKDKGYSIIRIDRNMTNHAELNNFKRYFWRIFRHGYGHAEVAIKFYKKNNTKLLNNFIKSSIKAIFTPLFILLAIISKNIYFLFFSILLNTKTILLFFSLKKKGLNNKYSSIYVIHSFFLVYPLTLGMLRYIIGKIFYFPFTNKKLFGKLY